MSMYHKNQTPSARSLSTSSLGDSQNMLLLRVDIHRLFDQGNFVFVPKGGKLAVHVLEAGSEVVNSYHDREMRECRCAIQFMFARFAWAVFKRLTGFLNTRARRKLLTAGGNIQELELYKIDMIDFLDGGEVRSRSASPKKRKQSELGNTAEEEADALASPPYPAMKRHYTPKGDGHEDGSSRKRTKRTHEMMDQPPTPPKSSSPASVTPSQERDNSLALVDQCAWLSEAEKRIRSTKIHALHAERLRSDPTGWFKKELAWARSLAGGPVTDITRWHQAHGYDVLDAEFDFDEPILGSEQESGDNGAGAGKGDLTEEKVGQLASKVKERVVGSVAFMGQKEDDRVELVSQGKGMGMDIGGMAGERMAVLGVLMEGEGEEVRDGGRQESGSSALVQPYAKTCSGCHGNGAKDI